MVERQLRRRGIADERVLEAMSRVPRESFLPEAMRSVAYDDGALPIGHGQTMSQPFIVASICALLGLAGDERVLDVGTGSGYQAAVLDELAAEVITIERIPELAAAARAALADTGHEGVDVRVGDGSLGVPDRAPYDAVAVAAAAPTVPAPLYDQLGLGGRLVVPCGNRFGQELVLVVKTERRSCGARVRSLPLRPARGRGRIRGWLTRTGVAVILTSATLRRLWIPRRRR